MNTSRDEFYHFLRLLAVILLMVATFVLGLNYVLNRHFQPDEFVLSKSINILNFPKELQDIIYIQFFMVPLSFFTKYLATSKEILQFLRVVFYVLMLMSIFILSNFSIQKKHYWAKMMVLIFLLTQYPLWRFGIEIRHEVILLFSLACSSYFFIKNLCLESDDGKLMLAAGLSLGLMGQTAYKGLVYSVGMSGIMLVFLVIKNKFSFKKSLKSFVQLMAGYLCFCTIALLILYFSGHLSDFVSVYKRMLSQSLSGRNFFPTEIFKDLVVTTPLTIIIAISFIFKSVRRVMLTGFANSLVSLYTLTLICFFTLTLFLSPIPFRYNIIIYLSTILIFIVNEIDYDWLERNKLKNSIFVAVNLIVFIFSAGQDYYLRYSNKFQFDYIKTAEDLSSPDGRIIDGMGIVATRPAARKEWALYFAQMPNYLKGEFEYFLDAFLTKTPEIAITNYRWNWLREEDLKILKERYIQIGEHMWILGAELYQRKGTFEIYKAGRYKIIKKLKSSKVIINKKEVIESIVFLEQGESQYEIEGGPATLLWLGPTAMTIPYLFVHKKQPFIVPIQ